MLIFGSRTSSRLMAAMILQCMLCHHTASQRLYKATTWFTFFFAPIFPFGHGKYTMHCSYCGSSTPLVRSEAERFIADAQGHVDAQPNAGQPQAS